MSFTDAMNCGTLNYFMALIEIEARNGQDVIQKDISQR